MGIPSRPHPIRFYALTALVLCAAGTAGLWWWLEGANTVPVWLGCWLAVVNGITFIYYGYDKARARGGEGRVPEVVLHGLAAVGGSPAAYLAMRLFRHKTVKGSFRILFWCIVLLQLSVAAYVAKLLWWS
jgi:uncharacterized membrane protein YsdA (DUF1294 family)